MLTEKEKSETLKYHTEAYHRVIKARKKAKGRAEGRLLATHKLVDLLGLLSLWSNRM